MTRNSGGQRTAADFKTVDWTEPILALLRRRSEIDGARQIVHESPSRLPDDACLAIRAFPGIPALSKIKLFDSTLYSLTCAK